MANYVAILKKGMDMTPGGKDEEAVPAAERLGEPVGLETRVQLLVDTTCLVMFNYVAQVCVHHMHAQVQGFVRPCWLMTSAAPRTVMRTQWHCMSEGLWASLATAAVRKIRLAACSHAAAGILFALQGLFERHKLIVATQLCMAVLRSKGELQRTKFEFLLRGPKEMGVDNPLGDWVSTAGGDY
jgi:hypothetical protein